MFFFLFVFIIELSKKLAVLLEVNAQARSGSGNRFGCFRLFLNRYWFSKWIRTRVF